MAWSALGELEHVGDEIVDAIDLPVDARLGRGAEGRGGVGFAEHLGGEADDVHGIFQVVDDGAGERPTAARRSACTTSRR
jgi:hypothetical protein